MANDENALKPVVVTGASRGIGRTIALDLSEHDFSVFAGVRKHDHAEALIEASEGRVSPLILDVTDSTGVAAAAVRSMKPEALDFRTVSNCARCSGYMQPAPS